MGSFVDNGSPVPRARSVSAGADSSSTEGYFEHSAFPLSPSSFSIHELTDEDKKKEAAERRE